jgi:conjugative transfer signal peptidase TraF
MKSRVRTAIVRFGFPAAVLFAMMWHSLPLLFNWTPSLPIGLYWITKDEKAPDLAFCMSAQVRAEAATHGLERVSGKCPDGTAWILKPNLRSAQVITFTSRGFTVDGRELPNTTPLPKDRFGRPMPHYPFGHYFASSKEVWVVSSHNERSYDSRYFGPIDARSIVCYARPILVMP